MSVLESPDSIFVGKHRIFLPVTESTNSLAKTLIERNEVFDGSIIVTANQTAGRGQRGNTWHAEPGKNLTVSFVLRPAFLRSENAYWLYLITSLAVYKVIEEHCNKEICERLKIKWPNDIYCFDKKISGILIENMIKGNSLNWAVIGIGINSNQTDFARNSNAASLAVLNNKQICLNNIERNLSVQLEKYYLLLKEGKVDLIMQLYTKNLLGYDSWRNYKSKNGFFSGRIRDIDKEGRLVVEKMAGTISVYNFKELDFLF